MSRSNRAWNRILLAVVGLAWVAVGALVGVAAVQPSWLAPVGPIVDSTTSALEPVGGWLAVVAALALIVLAGLVLHASTRGRGRTHDAVAVGGVTVDDRTVEDAYRLALGEHPDVLAASIAAWQPRRGETAWRASVRVHPGARVDEVVDRAASAARTVREQVGIEAPVVVHVTAGVRSALSATRRAA